MPSVPAGARVACRRLCHAAAARPGAFAVPYLSALEYQFLDICFENRSDVDAGPQEFLQTWDVLLEDCGPDAMLVLEGTFNATDAKLPLSECQARALPFHERLVEFYVRTGQFHVRRALAHVARKCTTSCVSAQAAYSGGTGLETGGKFGVAEVCGRPGALT